VLADKTIAVGKRGFAALVLWASGLDGERVWALEDCRHVSGALERFLIARGERVVRVSTRLMAGTRRSSRERGKSDQIDAVSVARASLAAGIETLPTAALAGPELHLRLLVDHRERLVRTRVALNNTLQWNLHDVWPELTLPGGALFSKKWTTKIARRLARAEQTMRVRIARDELRRTRELTQAIKALEAEIAVLVTEIAPQLVAEPGCGALTAAFGQYHSAHTVCPSPLHGGWAFRRARAGRSTRRWFTRARLDLYASHASAGGADRPPSGPRFPCNRRS
jgi:transposase